MEGRPDGAAGRPPRSTPETLQDAPRRARTTLVRPAPEVRGDGAAERDFALVMHRRHRDVAVDLRPPRASPSPAGCYGGDDPLARALARVQRDADDWLASFHEALDACARQWDRSHPQPRPATAEEAAQRSRQLVGEVGGRGVVFAAAR